MNWINPEINVGNLITVVTVLVTAIWFYSKQTFYVKQFLTDIIDIKLDLKLLNKVITDLAVQSSRLTNHDERLNRLSGYIDEIRHGKGLIED